MDSGRVESLLPGGDALLRFGNRVCLTRNGVPGDLVEFDIYDKKRGAERARITRVLNSSPDRVEAPCAVAAECGGCALQYLDASQHADVKSAWVRESFRKSFSDQTEWMPAAAGGLNSRRRLRWYVGSDAASPFLGFRASQSHRVVRHDVCLCATETLNHLRQGIESSVDLKLFESVQAVHLTDGIHLILEGGKLPGDFELPFADVDGMPVQWWQRNGKSIRPLGSSRLELHDRVSAAKSSELSIRIGPDDFIQGQREGNETMIRQVIEWCGGARFVVDLFSGVGNLSLPVAAGGCRVAGAELSVASVRAANANAGRLGLDAHYVSANLFETFDCEPFAGADVLILDPPRRGAKKVCSMMGRLLPARIVMVNCDVSSGGRDGEILMSFGYRLKSLRALDLFPYTGHVEAMSLWIR